MHFRSRMTSFVSVLIIAGCASPVVLTGDELYGYVYRERVSMMCAQAGMISDRQSVGAHLNILATTISYGDPVEVTSYRTRAASQITRVSQADCNNTQMIAIRSVQLNEQQNRQIEQDRAKQVVMPVFQRTTSICTSYAGITNCV